MKLILLTICALAFIRTSLSSEPCKDHFNCQIYPNSTCKTDEWVVLNCPKKCNICPTPVNPLEGYAAAPTSHPDVAIMAPLRNYTYPKPDEPSTSTMHDSPLPAATAPNLAAPYAAPAPAPAYPAPAPAPAYPTAAPTAAYPAPVPAEAYPTAAPTAAYQAPAPLQAYPTSAPYAAYPTPAPAYPAPTQGTAYPVLSQPPLPVYGMPTALPTAANQYPVLGQQPVAAPQINEYPNWVVKIPPKVTESLQNHPETIRISFVKQHQPVQQPYGVQEVNMKPKNDNGIQTMKISFIDEKSSKAVPHGVDQVRLPQPQTNNEKIRVSFRPQVQTPSQYQPIDAQYGAQNETGPFSNEPQRNISVSFMGHENETLSSTVGSRAPVRNITVAFTGHENETVSVPLVNTTAALPERNISVDFQGNHEFSMPLNGQGAEDIVNQVMNGANQTSRNISVSFLEKPLSAGQVTVVSNAAGSQQWNPPVSTTTPINSNPWCQDHPGCSQYQDKECDKKWMQVNCPATCNLCGNDFTDQITPQQTYKQLSVNVPPELTSSLETSREPVVVKIATEGGVAEISKETNGPIMERINVHLPSNYLYDQAAHSGLTSPLTNSIAGQGAQVPEGLENQQQDTNKMASTTDNVALSAQVGEANVTLAEPGNNNECFYDGLVHKHGERWSPGPCTPECRCHNGKIHCTIIECPKLHCKNTIKRRWKCCPECPPNEGVNSKCTKTYGGNSAGSCCVFPFSYKNKQYTKCIEENHSKPWCAVSSDFDIDGMWGNCLGQGEEMSDEMEAEAEAEKTIKVSFLNSQHNDEIVDTFLPSTALVTGLYSSWSDWSGCSASCGGGTQERTRKCLNPTNAPGGAVCDSLGPGLETKECNIRLCPINGGYGNWSEWTNCDASCGGGVQQRYRLCTNPSPAHGGNDCIAMNLGPALITQTCNTNQCPTDGMYSDWTGWTKCSKSCGLGKRYRFRYCTNPAPGPGGHNCSWYGNDKEEELCNNKECQVDGGYSPWTRWTECSRTCGPGIISRHRTCDNPFPSAGGKDCSNFGPSFDQKPCNMKECPSSGNWTVWSKWSECTRPCGGGIQFRSRQCNHPGGLQYCLGERVESSLCNSQHCPVDGNYTEFSDWTPCTTTCGVGIKTRERSCTNPTPQFGGKSCQEQGMGLAVEHEHCYNRQCPIHGDYTIWSEWKGCSKKCGYGEKTRTRSCTNPAPSNGGLDCSRLGESIQKVQCYSAECPLHGNYTAWSKWSACSATCGEGTTSRTRICANPEPAHGGDDCSALGPNIEAKTCKMHDCAVNGQYSPWSSWTICSKSCGSGITRRTRTCTDPAPLHGGKNCTEQDLGAAEEVSRCFDRPCPLNGGFNHWSAWTTCSASCGGGVMFRQRNCTSPQSMHGGKDCSDLGPTTESASCQDEPCPVNGNYGFWSAWSDCDKTCGGGKRIRSRSCTNPPPQFGGSDCNTLGPLHQTEICNLNKCPVHGNYSNWSLWSPCSVTCGVGTVERQRYCTNPTPSPDGRNCDEQGPSTEKKSCELVECTATCRCGPWADWSDCTTTCGGGIQQRRRDCLHPKNSKLSCEADSKETRLCMPEPCPINGKFTPWSPWTPCTATCGIGMKNRTRFCNAPMPQFGGKSCAEQEMGSAVEISKCYLMPCPVNGDYTEWSDWTTCSKSCGKGYKERNRYCTNPEPAYGGVDCARLGAAKESVECFRADCPVDGKYTGWTPWSSCSQTCGYGIQTRWRSCTDPEPMHGGRDCTDQGDPEHIRPCQNIPCAIHGNYSSWSAWGTCSKPCGLGVKKRTRLCNRPEPEFGGLTCLDQNLGPNTEEQKCFIEDCSVDGAWSAWSDWSTCSTACGPGTRARKRTCSNPEPKSGGKKCEGASKQVGDCTAQPCPVNGNYTEWSKWSVCDKRCGTGLQTRWRACANPVPQHGGLTCTYMGPDTETKLCLNKPCRTDGRWSEWSVWSTCSQSCGDGIRTRERRCDNPKPMEGGRQCDGDDKQYTYCKARDCCDVRFKPIGCYRDNLANDRPMPELLMSDVDSTSLKYNDNPMDYKRWNDYLPNLVCRCARAANRKGYSHFGLQDLGSCYSGSRSGMTFGKDGIQGAFIQSPAPKPWLGCVTTNYEQCGDTSKYCSGQQNSNFVYTFYNITPVDGGYSDWSPWSSCSTRCGTGFKSRVRNCTNPKPQYGGRDCNVLGDEVDTALCDTSVNCPVDGGFSDWGAWSNCSSSCGKGTRVRERSCSAPSPSRDGQPCIGPTRQKLSCNLGDCPVNGSWSAWGAWQACSATCGDGIQIRSRICNHPKPSNGGFSCEGDSVEQKSCKVRRCPVNGNYTDWSEWSDCSRTCGGGIHIRTRQCINPSPKYGGSDCVYYGDAREVVHCNPQPCPIHGNWGAWQMWSFCSATCGAGKRERMRLCNNPAPKYGGKGCPGTARELMPCSLSDCPVDGNWGAWKNWTQCSTTCGASKKSRTRECDNPPAAHGGRSCEGPEKEEAYCDNVPCMVNGGYTEWGEWTQCDVTCGGGRRLRSRACTNPLPQFGGRNCDSEGPDVQEDSCNTRPCAQNGEWSGWSVWSPCSRSCGSGVVKRIRTCTAPRPSYGGEPCVGEGEEIKACKIRDCCEVSYRDLGCFRDDHNIYRPLPNLLFSDVKDNRVDLENWDTYLSDVICRCARMTRNSGMTTFGIQNYGDCYSGERAAETYYQEGEQLVFSDQNQPKPWLGCIDSEKKPCHINNLECSGQERTNYVFTIDRVQPMQGNYTEWSAWSKCSKPCGEGERFRTRNCTNPPPAWGGLDCRFEGNDREQENCKIRDCPVDASWSNWGKWSTCTVSCGRGVVRRHRTCNNPSPQNGGKPCPGYAHETAECRMSPCPVDGKFSDWSAWSACSVTCGNGRQIRSRRCDSPKPAYGGNFCQGADKEFQNCEEDNCPGYFSDWSPWTTCSATCGAGGTRERSRTCQGGSSCAGSARQVERCDVQHCPHCPNTIDLAFLLDASGTIDDSQWKLTKDFVRGVSSAFHVADNGTRTAIITFSTLPHLEKTFQEMNEKDIMDAYLDSVTQPRGETRTDRALKLAREHILSDDSGSRLTVPKAVVMITDGGTRAKSKMAIQRRAHELKDLDGATVVVLGVGEKVDRQEIRQIVSDPEHAYLVSGYEDLMQYVKLTADAVCNAKPPPPPPRWGRWSDWSPCMKTCGNGLSVRTRKCLTGANCRGPYTEKRRCKVQDCPVCESPTDLAFAVPISSKIKDTEWRDVQNFVKGTASAFNISYAGTHLGLLSYSSMATLELKFNRYYYQKDLFTMVENVFPEASSEETTRLDDALQVANYELFTQASGSRPTAAKSLVVLSYGELGNQKLKNIAQLLRNNKVRSVVITIGQDEADRRQADSITNSNQTYHIGSFKDLVAIIAKTVVVACHEPEPILSSEEQTQVTQAQNQAAQLWKNRYSSTANPSTTTQAQTPFSASIKPLTYPPVVATIQKPPSYATSQWTSNTGSQNPTTVPNLATAAKGYSTQTTAAKQATMKSQATQQQQTTLAQQTQATQPQQKQKTLAQQTQATQSQQTQAQQTPFYWRTTETPKPTQAPYITQAATQKFANMPQETQPTMQNGHYMCPHNMDVVIALDSSSDVSPLQWAHQKSFARNVMESFTMSDTATHVGVVAYSTIPSIQSKLDENNQHDEVIKSIQSLPRDKGNRNLVILLEMAKFEMFTASGGMRQHVPKILLVGVMGTQKDHNTNSAKSLQAFSKQLQYSGVQVIAVGVGDVPEDDLKNMATRPNYALRVNSLQAAEAAKVAKVMCHIGALHDFNNPQAQSLLQNDNPLQSPPQPAPVQMNAPAPAAAASPAASPASPPVEMRDYPYRCRPVLYYDFDKMCSGTVYDESGMGNNGKVQGRILTEGGLLDDNGLDLSEGFIQLDGRGFKGKPTKAVTIAAWVHIKDMSTPNVHEIFVTESPGIQNDQKKGQYHFEILDKGKIRFFQRNYDKTVYGRTTKRVILPNRWVHIAGTYNPGSREATIYVNGERITEYEQTDPQETDALSTDWSDVAHIGSHYGSNQTLRKFKGALDEFYIFPCNLGTSEIKTLMETHKIPNPKTPFQGVKRMVWRNVPGHTISDLALSKGYPNNPTEVSIIPSFSAPENDGSDYGSRISGYFVAPYSGLYSFTLTGDDEAELFFSENASPKDKDLIAAVKTQDYQSQSPATQKSVSFPLEAGKHYWLEALHKQGKSRDALKVGYNLECPNAPSSVIQRAVIPPRSLQYQMPRSCADIKKAWSGYNDDEYAIQISPSCEPVRLYCYGMKTETPLEYITLEAGPDRNYAAFHRERLLNYQSCSGKTNPQPALTEKYWGKSRFYKVRVDPTTGLLERDDYRFADIQGNPVRYGRAGDCYSASTSCHKGRFQIDLTGTGLRLRRDSAWVPWGTPRISPNVLNYRQSPDGAMVYGECGGSCGGCQPKNSKLFVEPSQCLQTPTRAMIRGKIPKSKTDNIHFKKSHITRYFHSQPGLDESEMEVIGHIDRKRRSSQDINQPMLQKIRKFKQRLARGY
ncbi:uncharacterized protein LOC116293538 isoform X2 [Actinia tenebrosa]|uniref:Uncharacterized protein LOC116293538 isoform X2 n=1 Tax=Actinia tenebrosa TaxID=6105 RepID=A0A6P8HW28_ACTTE|nr:uncharacterized protein LOC116293538 isoform X2 [Actinia tenebrosa]